MGGSGFGLGFLSFVDQKKGGQYAVIPEIFFLKKDSPKNCPDLRCDKRLENKSTFSIKKYIF